MHSRSVLDFGTQRLEISGVKYLIYIANTDSVII